VPYTVLINPQLTPLSDEMEDGWKDVFRYRHARGGPAVPQSAIYRRGRQGQPIDRSVNDFHARVVQHEVTIWTASSIHAAYAI